ncbi:MAG: hypothetical protein AMS23_05035 [Bacteroides sp. SM1_62]|nr:MAG: hypothetical protein AMS26_08175 [Bacteroides sp. SM23_62]KPL25214.1 MAG: hypothetical protein AMS23_05035 [Bacteroides sp. SM1_62]
MLISMTGYGRAECDLRNMVFAVEIKSLNSKQLDFSVKIPVFLKEKEMEIRSWLGGELQRGKIELGIYQEIKEGAAGWSINRPVVEDYIRQLKEITGLNDPVDPQQLIEVAMRLPDTMVSEKDKLQEDDWIRLRASMQAALDELNAFREQEGKALEKDIRQRINNILQLLSQVAPFEEDRLVAVRNRILSALEELGQNHSTDPGRVEQEMIFYLEKMDITEEKVRLDNHCRFFLETLDAASPAGKKLGFIAQEIGREINTLGSKASDANIQRLVVEMKDELEKIKEQLLNVL